MSESRHQIALIEHASYTKWGKSLFAVPNGGKRNVIEAAKMKREGVRSGVPDLCLAIPNKTYHGLYMELKYKYNKLSDNQIEWIERLTGNGYYCCVSWSYESSINYIERYLADECIEGEQRLQKQQSGKHQEGQ